MSASSEQPHRILCTLGITLHLEHDLRRKATEWKGLSIPTCGRLISLRSRHRIFESGNDVLWLIRLPILATERSLPRWHTDHDQATHVWYMPHSWRQSLQGHCWIRARIWCASHGFCSNLTLYWGHREKSASAPWAGFRAEQRLTELKGHPSSSASR